MPRYYTYKDQVPLGPGETLGFETGKGYYAKESSSAPVTTPGQRAPIGAAGGGAGASPTGGSGNEVTGPPVVIPGAPPDYNPLTPLPTPGGDSGGGDSGGGGSVADTVGAFDISGGERTLAQFVADNSADVQTADATLPSTAWGSLRRWLVSDQPWLGAHIRGQGNGLGGVVASDLWPGST